jgi:hypothetical protein
MAAPARGAAPTAAGAAPAPAQEEAPAAAAAPPAEGAAPAEAPAPPDGAKPEARAETEAPGGEGDKAEGGKPGAKGVAAKAPAPPSPRKAIAPAIAAVRHRAKGARSHSRDPGIPVGSAQAASKAPKVEQARDSATTTVKQLQDAKTAPVARQSFKAQLKAAVDKAIQHPKTESEASHVMKAGAETASQALHGEMNTQRDQAVGQLKATAEGGDAAAPAPAESKLVPEPLGSAPAPVSAAPVVPEPLPEERLDYSEDRAPTDQAMAEAGVTKRQLEKGNEPAFNQTINARDQAEQHEQAAPTAYRQGEAKVQDRAKHAAQAELAQGLGGMHGARALQIAGVIGQQLGTQSKEAAERQRVTDRITGIKDETRRDVENILTMMEQQATTMFEQGLQLAEAMYHSVFEDAKGGAWNWLTNWGDDWKELIESSLEKARNEYMHQVDLAIDRVADFVDGMLENARRRVAKGRQDVDAFVDGLEGKAREFGAEARKAVAEDFDAMETQVDERRDALINKLVDQYKASYERMQAMEEKLREENKSLWEKVYDATVGLIKKILAFKDMLLNVLAKAASVIADIISDPIGFLGNLVTAVMRGLKNFMANIGTHLLKGLMEWLFGALAGAGLQLPDTFDLKGIVSIVLQVLGLTYANFRARAVNIVGEPVVAALEQAAEVFKIIITEGIPGLWRFIKEKLEDLKSMVMDAIFDFIKEKVLIAGVTWIIGLLNPASAFFKACKAIYDIVMFFVERGSQILALVNAIIDSIAAIARGSLDAAATWVETALAKAIPVAIGFLASLLGLGDISGTIRKTIEKAQAPVNKAIDWVINQAVKLVKAAGKFVGKLFGKKEDPALANKEPSDQVRAHATELVFVRLKSDHTREQAAVIVQGIETELRPMGLKALEIGPEDEDGTSPIVAEASAKRPLGNLTSGVPRPRGRSVTSKVQLELSVPEETPATELAPADPMRATTRIGGVAWTPAVRAAHKLNVVTWNTSNIDAPGNSSHAEHQFVHYMESRRELWANVEKITIVNVTRSPCSECGPELAWLLKEIKKERPGQPVAALIYWTKLHSSGTTPTSWQTLHEMERAGWVLNAPADALPPEKTVHAGMVHVAKL